MAVSVSVGANRWKSTASPSSGRMATFKIAGLVLMSRISWAMAAAFVVMAVTALLLISGPWSPRLVEKDAAGVPVGGPPRPLAPGTPINSARTPALPEGTAKSP